MTTQRDQLISKKQNELIKVAINWKRNFYWPHLTSLPEYGASLVRTGTAPVSAIICWGFSLASVPILDKLQSVWTGTKTVWFHSFYYWRTDASVTFCNRYGLICTCYLLALADISCTGTAFCPFDPWQTGTINYWKDNGQLLTSTSADRV